MKLADLTGQRFGRLVVIERAPNRGQKTFWLCQCDCGNMHEVQSGYLKRTTKPIRSCGCLYDERRVDRTSAEPACQRPTPKRPNGRTGTAAGYLAHYYVDQEPCPECLEGLRIESADWKASNKESVLRSSLWRRYRLTLERYAEMLVEQDGKCAICLVDAPRDIRSDRFHVDHDHACCPGFGSCGKCVRGLLCHACNTALGNFTDDPARLLRAIDYLDRRPRESLPAAAVRFAADAAESGAA